MLTTHSWQSALFPLSQIGFQLDETKSQEPGIFEVEFLRDVLQVRSWTEYIPDKINGF